MQVVLELLPSFPFAPPSAIRALLCPQDSVGTFPFRPSEVRTPVHGAYTTFGTHLQVSLRNALHTLCTFSSLELVYVLFWALSALLHTLLRASDFQSLRGRSND